MSKMLVMLGAMAAATGTLATGLIWTLLTDPAAMAAAMGDGNLKTIVLALLGAQ